MKIRSRFRHHIIARAVSRCMVQGIARDSTPAPVRQAAGVMCEDKDGNLLFLKRAGGDHEGEWCFPGGMAEEGETPEQTALRELHEETQHAATDEQLMNLGGAAVTGDLQYTTFKYATGADSFAPVLNDEHTEAVWADPKDPPSPLHPGVKTLLNFLSGTAKRANDEAMAFDRATVRTYDDNGRMRVTQANISKANVCPYLGSEIPDADALGLDPKKVYQLLRDPAELTKAVASFNGIPILNTHVPSTAWDHPSGKVVGTTGTDAVFEAPYLKNSLVIWTQDAISEIENREKQELSCGYKYRAEMTPGNHGGVAYDGRMVEILGNHVALVATGRAGPDVIVGDSQLQMKEMVMTTKKATLSRMAIAARGALMVALPPVLAADAEINLDTLLSGVTKKNYAERKPGILALIKPKMAADATLDDVIKLMDTLDKAEGVEDEAPVIDEPPANDGGMQAACDMFRAKGATDEEVDQMKALFGKKAGDMNPAIKPGGMDEDDEDDEDEKKEKVSKGAMDKALKAASAQAAKDIKLAADTAEKNTVTRLNGIAEARDFVHPYVGKLTMSFDSAEGVYRAALDVLKIEHKEIHPSALHHIVAAQPKPGDRPVTRLAQDSASKDFATRYPGVAAVRVIG